MEGSEGMVAVVRGLRDSGLAVTLLDGCREYTLMPNAVLNTSPAPDKDGATRRSSMQQSTQHNAMVTESGRDYTLRNTGAQVTDGRYASVYKTTHCHVKPSSPPLELTEFPPQRAELCPGQGNFEVGGAGSGETYSSVKANGKFRGGMNWSDRGAVCSPRASHESDAFANSLRKYPCVSPDRSAEIVERLINYSQTRASKTYNMKNQTSPQRFPDLDFSNHNLREMRMWTPPRTPQRWEPDPRDSPTRDRARKPDGDASDIRKTAYCKNYNVKCVKDLPRRFKENTRLSSTYPYNQPVCSPIKEGYEHHLPRSRRFSDQCSNNSVNMEIQAAVRMVSKEVATVPRPAPSMRTVAVPISPSSLEDRHEGDNTKSTQKSFASKRKSVQTISLTDISNSENDFDVKYSRMSKSQEDVRVTDEYFKRKMLAVFNNVSCYDRAMEKVKDECLKRLCNNKKRVRTSYNRCINNVYQQKYHLDEVVNNDSLIGYDKLTHVFRAEVTAVNINENIECTINKWVNDLPISVRDFDAYKRDILNNMALKLKELIMNRFRNEIVNLKSEILDLIVDIPIDTNAANRAKCLNKLADGLVERIKASFFYPHYNRNEVKTPTYKIRKQTKTNKKILKDFIRDKLLEYFAKFGTHVSENVMHNIENELINIIIENHTDVKHKIKYILTDQAKFTDEQACRLIKVLLETFDKITINNSYSQIFTVLQSTLPNCNDTTDFSIAAITQEDLNANLDLYMNQLCSQIDDWLNHLDVNPIQDAGFRQVVVHDLAGDIIDRHKYLELNSSSRGTYEEELEQLKYQIFKWVNKLVGENNTETIQDAEELMTRIKSVPVPMLMILPNKQNDVIEVKEQANLCPSPECQRAFTNKCSPAQFSDVPKGIPRAGRRISSPAETSFSPSMCKEPGGATNQNRRASSPGSFSRRTATSTSGYGSHTATCGPNLGSNLTEMNTPGFPNSAVSCSPPQATVNQPMSCQTWSNIDPEYSKIATPMPPSPSLNVKDNKINFPDAISSGPMMDPNNDPKDNIIDNGMNAFPDKMLNGPGAINTGPTQQFCGSRNENSNWKPQNMDQTAYSIQQPVTSIEPQPMPCCPGKDPLSQTEPTIKQLNDEYDQFLKQWVQQVPIAVSTPEEKAVAEKARLGLYNGIWKAITRLKFEPTIFNNRFYYQDVFDDELEDLLSILPKSPELNSKKHALKAKLIEKTTDTNEQIISLVARANYKQQLVDNVENSLPTIEKTDENVVKLHEELQKICLADDYILYIRYKDDDKVKANVYRKKLLKNVETLINNIKKNYGKELKDIDPGLYMNEIVSALNKVPVPSENTIREEADEILLGIEVEQWFSDLPIAENIDLKVQLQRKRLRDTLVKKIHDIEKERNLNDCVASKELRYNIFKFLAKIPLMEGTDRNFVVEELVNRLKNRPREEIRKKSVAFQEPQGYEEFKNNLGQCSTLRQSDRNFPSLESISQRSVGSQEPQDYQEFSRNMPSCSSYMGQPAIKTPTNFPNYQTTDEQWVSLNQTKLPLSSYQPTPSVFCRQPVHRDTSNQTNYQEPPYRSDGVLGTSQIARSCRTGFSKASTQPYGKPITDSSTQFYKSTDHRGIQDVIQNRSMNLYSGHQTSSNGQPVGPSTPQYSHRQHLPERPKKVQRQAPRRLEDVRRRFEIEDTESEGEREVENRCRCLERPRCIRRRSMLITCGDYDKHPQFIPCPCAYFL